MAADMKTITEFLKQIGIEDLVHTGQKSYIGHNFSVRNDLEKWGCEEWLCLAGIFHSIYGTERFQRFQLPWEQRPEVRELIGERAEEMAWWNCIMDRPTFDAAVGKQTVEPYTFLNRLTSETIELTEAEFNDLCTLHLCDWLEQVGRSADWGYRREAYRGMAERLGGIALESYDKVFANESTV